MRILLYSLTITIFLFNTVFAASVKIKTKGDNFIIIKEKRKYGPSLNPVPLQEAENIVNDYCSNKGLYGFYVIAKLSNTVNDTSIDFRKHIGATWPDLVKSKYRYFCAQNEDDAFKLFQSDKKYKSKIKIYPGGLNSYNGYLTKNSHIKHYFTLPTDPVLKAEKRRLVEEEIKRREEEKKIAEEKRKKEKRIAEKKKKEEEIKKAEKKKIIDEKIVPAASGTGFFVSKFGHLITNHHVIEGCDANKLSFNGKLIEANVLSVDKKNDLAILKADIVPIKVYPISNEDASLLEDIIIAGYPLGKKVSAAIKTSKGSITALAGFGDNYSEFQTDAALNQGNSGGPIMNQKGNVVGVAVANYGKKSGVESFNFGIKSSTLKTFANSNGLKFEKPNSKDLSNKELGKLITDATIYLECYMTVAKIKKIIAEAESRKAFFSEFK